jgi:hypothetical protein
MILDTLVGAGVKRKVAVESESGKKWGDGVELKHLERAVKGIRMSRKTRPKGSVSEPSQRNSLRREGDIEGG